MAIAVFSAGVLGIGALIGATQDVVTGVDRETQACSIERRNIDSLSAILRGVPIETLTNFGADGLSMAPQFSRSLDIVNGLPQPTAQAQLMWLANSEAVAGVTSPGAVWLIEGGAMRLAAANVPGQGFAVEQDGKRLIIRLTTYYPGRNENETVLRNSTTVVWPRN